MVLSRQPSIKNEKIAIDSIAGQVFNGVSSPSHSDDLPELNRARSSPGRQTNRSPSQPLRPVLNSIYSTFMGISKTCLSAMYCADCYSAMLSIGLEAPIRPSFAWATSVHGSSYALQIHSTAGHLQSGFSNRSFIGTSGHASFLGSARWPEPIPPIGQTTIFLRAAGIE